MSVWDSDFNKTQIEYDGVLEERVCEYCGKSLLSDEPEESRQEYNRVCPDCVDVLREGGSE